MDTRIPFSIVAQPDATTCGPTCLHAVYRYHGDETLSLDQVIKEVTPLQSGGTLAAFLAIHALHRGFRATIYTYNLQVFDPTWFNGAVDLAEMLRQQMATKSDPRLQNASKAYLEFLKLGGEIRFRELNASLLRQLLEQNHPVLTGLSATYLYNCAREHDDNPDTIRGHPVGHFVVLCGYDQKKQEVLVADPLQDNPRYQSHIYRVNVERLLGAIFLGIVTYDGNLLVIEPIKPKS